jgi:hypothetical protein
MRLRNEVETPEEGILAGGLCKTFSTATTPAIAAPMASHNTAPAVGASAATSSAPEIALKGTITMLKTRSTTLTLSRTISSSASPAKAPVMPTCGPPIRRQGPTRPGRLEEAQIGKNEGQK